jgi:hypothetical protein
MTKGTARLALIAMLAFGAVAAPSAEAAYVVTFSEEGHNVVESGSGTLDVNDLTELSPEIRVVAQITPDVFAFSPGALLSSIEGFRGRATGPGSFGDGSATLASDSSGGGVALINLGIVGFLLSVPNGYRSGAALSDSSTIAHVEGSGTASLTSVNSPAHSSPVLVSRDAANRFRFNSKLGKPADDPMDSICAEGEPLAFRPRLSYGLSAGDVEADVRGRIVDRDEVGGGHIRPEGVGVGKGQDAGRRSGAAVEANPAEVDDHVGACPGRLKQSSRQQERSRSASRARKYA